MGNLMSILESGWGSGEKIDLCALLEKGERTGRWICLSPRRWPWQGLGARGGRGPDLVSQQSTISSNQAALGNLREPVSRAQGLGWFLGQKNSGQGLRLGSRGVEVPFCRARNAGPLNPLLSMRKSLPPGSENAEPKPRRGHSVWRHMTKWTEERRKPPRKTELSSLPFCWAPKVFRV